jgi:hypothetical protein
MWREVVVIQEYIQTLQVQVKYNRGQTEFAEGEKQ